jgi:hypothetical protein
MPKRHIETSMIAAAMRGQRPWASDAELAAAYIDKTHPDYFMCVTWELACNGLADALFPLLMDVVHKILFLRECGLPDHLISQIVPNARKNACPACSSLNVSVLTTRQTYCEDCHNVW